MPKICYVPRKFKQDALALIVQANQIIGEYEADSLTLTLDHDPSGIDMTRDIRERLSMFGAGTDVIRIALNMDQVQKYQPPPNPAKETDARFAEYSARFGDESWELDALDPRTLRDLVTSNVARARDELAWEAIVSEEKEHRADLRRVARHWGDVALVARGRDEEEVDEEGE